MISLQFLATAFVVVLAPGVFGIVEPTVLHEVEPRGTVRFLVEFYRRG